MMLYCKHFVTARSRSKSMVQQTPSSEFDSHVRSKRVRSKSESVSSHPAVSLFVVFTDVNVTM